MRITCPICDLPLQRVRQPLSHEPARQMGLPPGWDCPLGHAETEAPADYEQARVQRLIGEITHTLDDLRSGIPLRERASEADQQA